MNSALRIGLGVVAVVVVVFAGLAVGWALWGRQLWVGWEPGMGQGMMGERDVPAAPCTGWGRGGSTEATEDGTALSDGLTIEDARKAVERYVAALGYPNLEIAELMEFERNFYAIVRETDTRIGAMELLIDKRTGAVGPEMGPNMMWNTRYGMHGRGTMDGVSETNPIAPEEAIEIAQRWLDTNRPGVTVEEHADPFYGYYTIHTLRGGEIDGMLSIQGTSGQVWYHTWHGAFVRMIEGSGEDG